MRWFIAHGGQSDQYDQRRNGQYRADQMADCIEIFIAVWCGDQRVKIGFLRVHVREYILYPVPKLRESMGKVHIVFSKERTRNWVWFMLHYVWIDCFRAKGARK